MSDLFGPVVELTSSFYDVLDPKPTQTPSRKPRVVPHIIENGAGRLQRSLPTVKMSSHGERGAWFPGRVLIASRDLGLWLPD